jgi:hypothetical protein
MNLYRNCQMRCVLLIFLVLCAVYFALVVLVFEDLFTFVFLRVYLLGQGGASHDSFPVSTSSPLHGWPPHCGCGLLHALEPVFVFNPIPQEAEHSPHSLHFVYVPHFPSTIP